MTTPERTTRTMQETRNETADHGRPPEIPEASSPQGDAGTVPTTLTSAAESPQQAAAPASRARRLWDEFSGTAFVLAVWVAIIIVILTRETCE